ncbi:MAG: hypothetical protein K5697_15950 [Lachnospiraceae bacterium]|nr:hypothetical protein [Lachnospiraceae bacterium]
MENEILAQQLKEKQAKEMERLRLESVAGLRAEMVGVEQQDLERKRHYLDYVATWKSDVRVEMAETPSFGQQMLPREQTSAEDKAYREEQKRQQQQRDQAAYAAFQTKKKGSLQDKITLQAAGKGGVEQLEIRVGEGPIGKQKEKRNAILLKLRIAMGKLDNLLLRGALTNEDKAEEEKELKADIEKIQEGYDEAEVNGIRKYYESDNPYGCYDSETFASEEKYITAHMNEKTGEIIRKDAFGRERRQNMAKYRNGGRGSDEAAEKDVENLVTNLRLDLALSGKIIEPNGPMLTIKKAYAMVPFFTDHMNSAVHAREHEIKERKKMLEETGNTNTAFYKESEREEKSFISSSRTLDKFTLALRESCSNLIFYDMKMKEITAMELAEQIIRDAPASAYTKKMLRILSDKKREAREAIEAEITKRFILLNSIKYGVNQKGWDVMSDKDFGLIREFANAFDALQEARKKTGKAREAAGVAGLQGAYRKIDEYLAAPPIRRKSKKTKK